ncbi:TPA: hypothetical protein HA265_07900 [Candidatus Woesearchaeota archaeon]|nr:hypothetical protein [Candidatus Woesearchaeota archaeon]
MGNNSLADEGYTNRLEHRLSDKGPEFFEDQSRNNHFLQCAANLGSLAYIPRRGVRRKHADLPDRSVMYILLKLPAEAVPLGVEGVQKLFRPYDVAEGVEQLSYAILKIGVTNLREYSFSQMRDLLVERFGLDQLRGGHFQGIIVKFKPDPVDHRGALDGTDVSYWEAQRLLMAVPQNSFEFYQGCLKRKVSTDTRPFTRFDQDAL